MDLTVNDLLAELSRAASVNDDNALTTRDILKATGWGSSKAQRVVRDLVEAGRLKPVQVLRERVDGYRTRTTGYVVQKGRGK
jgi:uncharacterized ParB-like nuclease family protein